LTFIHLRAITQDI